MASTIRLRPRAHQALKEITQLTGQSMQDALETALEDLRQKVYLEGLCQDYKALRADPKASKEFDLENAFWERTNSDGLEDL
jgi:hypothetical protein